VVATSRGGEEGAVVVGGDAFVVFGMSTRAFLVATSAPAEKKLWRVRFLDMIGVRFGVAKRKKMQDKQSRIYDVKIVR